MRRANAEKSKIRSRVEHVFAEQKDRTWLFIRTIGIARAKVKIGMANLVYNVSIRLGRRRLTRKSSAAVARFQLFVYFDEFDEIFDAEIGEGHNAILAGAVDPDNAIHSIGDVKEPLDAFAKAYGVRSIVVT